MLKTLPDGRSPAIGIIPMPVGIGNTPRPRSSGTTLTQGETDGRRERE